MPRAKIVFLDGEAIIADLRRSVAQRLTDNPFRARNMILTNKRLIVVDKRLGSFKKEYVFLRDLQGVTSYRKLKIGLLLFIIALALFGTAVLIASDADHKPIGLISLLLCLLLGLSVRKSLLRVSSIATTIDFDLGLRFSLRKADRFVHIVQSHVAVAKGA